MLKKLKYTFLFLLIQNAINAQEFYLIFPNLNGEELLENLVEEFKPIDILNYSRARDTLFSIIDNHNDSLTCVYTGHTIYIDPNEDPTQAAFQNGNSDGINTEHTFPQSMGASTGNARSDMHHLFPTRSAVNSARGNNKYGEIDDSTTNNWYYLNMNQTNIPNNNTIALYSESDELTFEPREDHKGDVARAMFYFYTMYKHEADNANQSFFESQRETLCHWNIIDPIDQEEQIRSTKISEYQEGKINPFIFDCTLAAKTYCPNHPCQTTSLNEIETDNLVVYPNPTTDNITINLGQNKEESTISLYDTYGNQIFIEKHTTPNAQINLDLNSVDAGIYNLQIIRPNGKIESRVILKQ